MKNLFAKIFSVLILTLLASGAFAHCDIVTDPDNPVFDACVDQYWQCVEAGGSRIACEGTSSASAACHLAEATDDCNKTHINFFDTEQHEPKYKFIAPIDGTHRFDYVIDINTYNLDLKYECVGNMNFPISSLYDCMRNVIVMAGDALVFGATSYLAYFVSLAVIIALIWFGYRVALGAARVQAETVVFIFKMLILLTVTSDVTVLLWIRDFLISLSIDFSSFIVDGIDLTFQNTGDIDFGGTAPNLPVIGATPSCFAAVVAGTEMAVFNMLDCNISRLLGIFPSTDADFQHAENFIGIGAVFTGLLFTGSIGMTITMVVVTLFLTLIFGMVEIAMLFVVSLIAVCFLIGITPIIAPLWLFQPTAKIATQWAQHILSYSLQPVVAVAFLVMAMGVLGDIVEDLRGVYSQVKNIMEDGSNRKSITVIDFPTSVLAYDNPLLEKAKAEQADQTKPFQGSSYYTWIPGELTGGTQTTYLVQKNSTNESNEYISLTHKSDYLDLSEGQINDFIAKAASSILLLLIIVGFMRRLPNMISEMVGKGLVSPIASYGHSVGYGLGDKISGTVQKMASSNKK